MVVALTLAALLAGTFAASAAAKTIHVRAKQDNAITKALANRANPGDRLVVHKGVYDDPVVVDEAVRIVGKKKKRGRKSKKPVIAAGCAPETAVDVTADGVKLRRLKIRGGEEYSLDMSFVDSGEVRQVRLIDTCNALYGINVYQGGAIELAQNRPSGYLDAGIYIGGITDTGTGSLGVLANESFGNNRGLIVEDSFPPAQIRVAGNDFQDNDLPGVGDPSGIFVHNSDEVTFSANIATDNGAYGIHLDANSDLNRLFDNAFTGNGVQNVLDDGTGNCGSGNSPNVFPAC